MIFEIHALGVFLLHVVQISSVYLKFVLAHVQCRQNIALALCQIACLFLVHIICVYVKARLMD